MPRVAIGCRYRCFRWQSTGGPAGFWRAGPCFQPQNQQKAPDTGATKELSVDADVQILTHRVAALEDTMGSVMGEIRDGIREIAVNTGKLAVLEERHAETRDGLNRAFDEIKRIQAEKCETSVCSSIKAACLTMETSAKALESRVSTIETAMPGLKETRGWMIALAGIVIVFVVGALLALVVRGG